MADLEDRHYLRLEPLGKGNRIMDVIEMPMCNQNRVDSLELVAGGILRISIRPWIQYDDLTGFQLQLERPVSKPGDLDHCVLYFLGIERPSPYFASCGIVTGSFPLIAISPKIAFAAAISA